MQMDIFFQLDSLCFVVAKESGAAIKKDEISEVFKRLDIF